MPTPESADEFLRLAEESGVVDKPELEKALKSLTEQGADLTNASTLANSLVSNQTLTRWQAGKLLEGRHQGFTLGKYRLLSLLGKGSMGTVYLAEHTMMRRRVALKVLPFDHEQQPAYLDRFIREAQAVASLDHANIVRAYDVGKEHEGKRDVYYLAMEYVDGQDMAHYLKDNGPLDFVRAANLIRQVARGLSHAHDRGLTHRDVKPGNLLLDRDDVIRILDLGLAVFHSADQDEEASLTVSNNDHLLGTADYISPEQARNSHEVDHRTDIYSLGCTFYFMLTGFPPFRQGTVTQRLLAHQTQTPPPVTERRPDFPADLGAILDRMLAKTTDERYQSCHDVAGELKNWLLENADDAWKAKHPEIFTSEKIADNSVFEDVEPPTSASDTMVGPSPFDDETTLLTESSPEIPFTDSAPPLSENVESATPVTAGESAQNINAPPKDQQFRRIVIAICGVGALIAALFAIQHWANDSSTDPVSEQAPSEVLTTNDPEPSTPTENEPPERLPVDRQPGTESTTTETVEKSDHPALPTPIEQWRALNNQLKRDPTTCLYISFDEPVTDSEEIPNETHLTGFQDLRFTPQKKPQWTKGRWPGTRALQFDGTQDGQYLALDKSGSQAFNLSGSISVVIWFRVDEFAGEYTTLMAKGDGGFRIARSRNTSGLAFGVNRWVPPKDQDQPRDYAEMAEVHAENHAVDDHQWHMVAGILEADSDQVTIAIYVDGELRNRIPSEADQSPTPDALLIGANGYFLTDKTLINPRTKLEWVRPARQFSGSIDEVMVLNRAMDAEEITRMYELGRPQ